MKLFKQLTILIASLILNIQNGYSQTIIKLEKVYGVYKIPCKVNGILMNFIFDTGASDVSISLTEAKFLEKQGLLLPEDYKGKVKYRIANGDIEEGTKIILRKISIDGLILENVEASIVNNLQAPLLFGLNAISKLGKVVLEDDRLLIYPNNLQTENNDDATVSLDETSKTYKNIFISLFNSLKNKKFDNFYENHKDLFFIDKADSAGTKRSIDYRISRDTTSSFYKLYKFGKSQGINWKNIDTNIINITIDTSLDFIKAKFIYNGEFYVMHTYFMLNLEYFNDTLLHLPEVFVTSKVGQYWEGLLRLEKKYKNREINQLDFYNQAINYSKNESIYFNKNDSKYLSYFRGNYWDYYNGRYKEIDGMCLENLAGFYRKRGDYFQYTLKEYIKAIQDYNKVIEADSTNQFAYHERGRCKLQLEDYYGALKDFDKCIKYDHYHFIVYAYFSRGCAKFFLKNYLGAIQDYNKYITTNLKDEVAYYNRGSAKFELKDKKGACADWSQSGELGYKDAYDMLSEHCK